MLSREILVLKWDFFFPQQLALAEEHGSAPGQFFSYHSSSLIDSASLISNTGFGPFVGTTMLWLLVSLCIILVTPPAAWWLSKSLSSWENSRQLSCQCSGTQLLPVGVLALWIQQAEKALQSLQVLHTADCKLWTGLQGEKAFIFILLLFEVKFLWGDLSWRLAKIRSWVFDWHTDIFTVNYSIWGLCSKSHAIKLSTMLLSLWLSAHFNLDWFAIFLSRCVLKPQQLYLRNFLGPFSKFLSCKPGPPKTVVHAGTLVDKTCLSAHSSSQLLCLMLEWGTCSDKNCDREGVWPCSSPYTPFIISLECEGCGCELSWIWTGEKPNPGAENYRSSSEF